MKISVYHYNAFDNSKEETIREFKYWDFSAASFPDKQTRYVAFNKKYKLYKSHGVLPNVVKYLIRKRDYIEPSSDPLTIDMTKPSI